MESCALNQIKKRSEFLSHLDNQVIINRDCCYIISRERQNEAGEGECFLEVASSCTEKSQEDSGWLRLRK